MIIRTTEKHQEGEQHPPDADHLGCMGGGGGECVAMKRLI